MEEKISIWVVAYEENVEEVKAMSNKMKRRGSKSKRQVTHMYRIDVLPDNEDERNKMLNQPTTRVDKWLARTTERGIKRAYFHYIHPGVMGTLVGHSQGSQVASMASLLMEPQPLSDEIYERSHLL